MSMGETSLPGTVRKDAILHWMTATGEVLDAYPDEPVWSDRQLDEERTVLELRMAPIFRD